MSAPLRLLLSLAVVLAALGAAPHAHAADAVAAAQLAVIPAGETVPQTLDLAALAGHEDVLGVRYVLRDADGTTGRVTVARGFSLASLLREAGVDLDAFTYAEVPRADGTDVLVLREDVMGDVGGTLPPVVWVDADGTHFLRGSAGEHDVNADDLVTAADGTISVQLQAGQPFAVRIDASARRVRRNQPVRFEVVLVAGDRAADMDFDWYFADGSPNVSGVRVTHRFRRSGTYLVQVNVVKSGQTLDAHDVQVVRVTHPRPEPTGGGAGDSGSEGGGGGTGDGSGTGGGTGSGGGAGSGDGSGSGSGSGGGATSGSGSGTSASGGGSPATATPSHRSRRMRPPASATPAPQGELVSGTLLASADAVPLPAGDAGGSGGHADGAKQDRPLHVPAGVWAAALLVVLLAAGWTLESRHIPPFWQP